MKKPLLLHYYITNRCNSRCVFCNIWHETPKVDANIGDVAENLRQARGAGCKFVDFTGGEPLMHPQLPEFLSIAKKRGFTTSVTTNCILFEKRAKELSGLVDLLHFSIDADEPALHNRLRGCDSYHHVIKSIDAALKNRLYPDLLFTYTDENINSMEGVLKIARDNKLMLILDPVFALWGADKVSANTHRKALEFSRNKGVYLNRAHILLRDGGGNHVRDPLCRAVSSTVVITPDNCLALPCYHHRCANIKISTKLGADDRERPPHGDISRSGEAPPIPIGRDLGEILRSADRREAVAKEGRYSFCEGCHINCYFDPSYQYMSNRYRHESIKSKFRYAVRKYLLYGRPWPRLF